jgi:hypothetical protein
VKRRWGLIFLGSILGGGFAQVVLSSCATNVSAADATGCQSWAVGELNLDPPFGGPADPGVKKPTLVPAGWEPFGGWSQTDLVYIRKCVQ